jgi:membrane fusion protein, multidrug efflux system
VSHISELVRIDSFKAATNPSNTAKSLRNRPAIGALALVALAGLGLGIWHVAGADSTAVATTGPVPVTVAAMNTQSVRIWSDFSGRMNAVDSADIRPEVSGRITEIRFKDGQTVHAGDILMVIDPRPYVAAVQKAEADLATANTNAKLANVEFVRAQRLMAAQAVARDLYDQRDNAQGVAAASIKSAQAELAQAQLDVDHAYVKAPISGRVSRAEITVGNLVQAGANAPLLTSIVSDNGIYADFDVDEQTYLRSIHDHASTTGQQQNIPVQLTIQGDNRAYSGTIESFDNKIDTSTGTIRARARFANTDGALVPGMFVTVRLASAANSKVLLVAEEAVGSDQSKRFVYVVGPDNKAMFREITLGQSVNGRRVVTSGLKPGERVILDGLQRVMPGDQVAFRADDNRKFARR